MGDWITISRSLLHVRGGVSQRAALENALVGSSPRPWRCFCEYLHSIAQPQVFSTSVEVFLIFRATPLQKRSLLHVRGGVSIT